MSLPAKNEIRKIVPFALLVLSLLKLLAQGVVALMQGRP